MDDAAALAFDDLAADAAVLGVYRQVFAVLAREAGAMILDPSLVDVDESILKAFADSGPEGLTVEQVVSACGQHTGSRVRRRFDVLREYRAIERVNERAHELYYRAAFAPYVMLLFLRRIAEKGGQAELHQLLTLERLTIKERGATLDDGRGAAHRLATVFRLLANQLAGLAAGGVVESLRENAQLLWGNHALLDQANEVHREVLDRWPELDRECRAMRLAVAAYRDAIDAAAGRLIEQAGTTQALGFLPVEAWKTFTRRSDVDTLAGVLAGFMFDSPAPWFSTEALFEAVESGRQATTTRTPPPRPQIESSSLGESATGDDDAELRKLAEQLLGDRAEVTVAELLDDIGDWAAGRRLLAQLIAIHQLADLPFRLRWGDGLRVNPESKLSWVAQGWFGRTPRSGEPIHD